MAIQNGPYFTGGRFLFGAAGELLRLAEKLSILTNT
jgi:hypothetical protein